MNLKPLPLFLALSICFDLSIVTAYGQKALGLFAYTELRGDSNSRAKVYEFTSASKGSGAYFFRLTTGSQKKIPSAVYKAAVYYPQLPYSATVLRMEEELKKMRTFRQLFPASKRYLASRELLLARKVQMRKNASAPRPVTDGADVIASLTLPDGKVLKNVTLRKVTPDGVNVFHEGGSMTIPFDKLPNKLKGKVTKLWEKRAAKGNMETQLAMADSYRDGTNGYLKDIEKAAFLYLKVAEKGHLKTQVALSECYQQVNNVLGLKIDPQKEIYWLEKAAEQGGAEEQLRAGVYYRSTISTTKNPQKAIFWVEKAAAQNHPEALALLGMFYSQGKITPKNYKKAISSYEKAAELDHVTAQSVLAQEYMTGDIVKRDGDKVFYWSKKAALQGNMQGQCILGHCYTQGLGVAVDHKKAVYWTEKAAEQGDPMSQFLIAVNYFQGLGVEQNSHIAKKWFVKSLESDLPEQTQKLARETLKKIQDQLRNDTSQSELASSILKNLKVSHLAYQASAGKEHGNLTPSGGTVNAEELMRKLARVMQKNYEPQANQANKASLLAYGGFKKLIKQVDIPEDIKKDFERYTKTMDNNKDFFTASFPLSHYSSWWNSYQSELGRYNRIVAEISKYKPH